MTERLDPRPLLWIVDDDEAFRDSLSALLCTEDFEVRAAASADAFLDQLPAGRIACALIDLHMPGQDGLELLERLGAARAAIPVIVMTGAGDVRSAVRAMQAGAIDFIEKPLERDALLDMIRKAFALSRSSASQSRERTEFRLRLERLTEREREVFERLLRGESNKAIARELQISPRTVEIHRARVMQKLEAENMAQLVRAALRAEVVPEQP